MFVTIDDLSINVSQILTIKSTSGMSEEECHVEILLTEGETVELDGLQAVEFMDWLNEKANNYVCW